MGFLLESTRAFCYFLGINLIFFIITIAIMVLKAYFGMSAIMMDVILRVVSVWPQP